jgi:hypothetical protein
MKLSFAGGSRALRSPIGLAALVPLVIVSGWLGWQIAAGTRWETDRLNPVDAILFRDFAQAIRSVENGADPNRVYPVSTPDGTDSVAGMTPLEAAVRVEKSELIRALLQYGARADAPERQRLACLALSLGDEGTVEILHDGPIEELTCD